MTIAITGVTGKLGSRVAKGLSDMKIPAKLLARRPEAVENLPYTTINQAYYDNSLMTFEALTGVDILFMVSAKESANRMNEHKAFIDAAKSAGVKHIIYTSFYNAGINSTFTLAREHAETEAYIREQGFTFTFIRDNFYLDFFVEMCREYRQIKGPAGAGKVSAVLREDVANVVIEVLKNPKTYENRILNMTGPESLSLEELTKIVSKAWQKNILYIPETVEEAYQSRKAWEAKAWEYDSWVSTYTAIAADELSAVSSDIEEILGRPATSLEEFLSKS